MIRFRSSPLRWTSRRYSDRSSPSNRSDTLLSVAALHDVIILLCAPTRNCSSLFRSKFFVCVRLDERLLLGFINHGAKPIELFGCWRLRSQQGNHHSV
jgi:hypothetical protein